jgi:chromosome segregation ATPase
MSEHIDHEQIFDEIVDKLSDLSAGQNANRTQDGNSTFVVPAVNKAQDQIRKSQEDLRLAQIQIQEKIKAFDLIATNQSDLSRETRRMSEQIEVERSTNSKLSSDLAKSLELNLKLQFEIEEVRTRATQALTEEKKHNQFLQDKIKNLNNELDLSQALSNETRLELSKAKDRFQLDSQNWLKERQALNVMINDLQTIIEDKNKNLEVLSNELTHRQQQIDALQSSLSDFDNHSQQQSEVMKTLSHVAEQKMIELKMALDKKSIECQDYYSHLQQVLTQLNVLKQENGALKEYIGKVSVLHQIKSQEASL